MRPFNRLVRPSAPDRGSRFSSVSRTRQALVVLGLAGSLSGCFATGPPHNLPFRPIGGLRDLEGTYRNLGEAGKSEGTVYLSSMIWGNMIISHPSIEAIEVRSAGDSALVVRALAGGKIARETTLARGKDFKVRSGRLSLRRGFGFPMEPGTPGLFVTHGTVEIGLDQEGHGKYRNRGELLGLIYLVVPVLGHASHEVRFRRISP
jgi:hypothetical protein